MTIDLYSIEKEYTRTVSRLSDDINKLHKPNSYNNYIDIIYINPIHTIYL